MMSVIRAATDREAVAWAGVRQPHRQGTAYLLVRGDDIRAAAAVSSTGLATEPDVPCLAVVVHADDFDQAVKLPLLLAALLEEARRLELERIMIGWSPMDAAGLGILERLGFRPVGRMPYFEIGGGQVEYVSGYRDATGSILDLALELPR